MLHVSLHRYIVVALSLVGSAIALFSCEEPKRVPADASSLDDFMTEYSEHLSMFQVENGVESYLFEAPLMEGYMMARDPYREFRKGIDITTYDEDSVGVVKATLRANYAIFYEKRKLWEAKGDVVVIQRDGRSLYTSQLFWNQATHRIYSNVDSKIVDGDEIYHCEGFESDESMKEWSYRKLKGVTYFTESDAEGSGSGESTAAEPATKPQESQSQQFTTKSGSTKAVSKPVRVRRQTAPKPSSAVSSKSEGVGEPLDIGLKRGGK